MNVNNIKGASVGNETGMCERISDRNFGNVKDLVRDLRLTGLDNENPFQATTWIEVATRWRCWL